MPRPSHCTVTIDGDKFDAFFARVGYTTPHDGHGMPLMGSMLCEISVTVDIHDNLNMPFATLAKLFELGKLVTRDKIKDIKIELWTDERQQDAICVYKFRGWIASFHTESHGDSNHLLTMTFEPELDPKSYVNLQLSN
ncbi:MAG TPA: hypothetical protein VKX25_16410 [Bryobacteraceae bacterium]|jgi:hypothetical protein|nr:hypothetical protein [Bryobacteraceae bacterium]